MLERPEVGTASHILMWLAGKTGRFYWPSPTKCACAEYSREFYGSAIKWASMKNGEDQNAIQALNMVAHRVSRDSDGNARWGDYEVLYHACLRAWR